MEAEGFHFYEVDDEFLIWRPFYFVDFPGDHDLLGTVRFIWQTVLAIVPFNGRTAWSSSSQAYPQLSDSVSTDWNRRLVYE